MKIDFPDHPIGPWVPTPVWMIWKPLMRRRNWRWTVDHLGCRVEAYWEYSA